MNYKLLSTTTHGTPCPECKAISFEIGPQNLLNYFTGQDMVCSNCNEKLDWWKILLRHFEWEIPNYLFSIVGAYDTWVLADMKANEVFTLDLEEVGIPKNSKILHIGYTPNGDGLFPLEIHGNSPHRSFIPHELNLYGRPFGNPQEITPVVIAINWIHFTNDVLWSNLIEAVEAFSIKKYQSTIIPANVAVEAKLFQVSYDFLIKHSSKDNVKAFLENGATYSHQLNIMLPLIAESLKFPQLPDHIRGNLRACLKIKY